MKTCSCGRKLNPNASTCPQCGKRFTTLTTWILAPILAFILVGFLGCCVYSCGMAALSH